MTTFRRILVPHDFSVHADRALLAAADLVSPGGDLVLLHVVVPAVPIGELPAGRYISEEEFAYDARRQLEKIVKRILRRRCPKVTIKVAIGDPRGCIVREGRTADLIVISTAGRTGLAHLVVGSVAESVVRNSAVPVLTLRADVGRRVGARRGMKRESRRRG